MKNHFKVWGLAYFFLIEIISYIFWDNPFYALIIYPVLNGLGFIVLLSILLLHSEELKFCKFKKTGIVALILYFFDGIFSVIFRNVDFIENVSYFYILISTLILIKTWKRFTKT